jgi:hypothetical protein
MSSKKPLYQVPVASTSFTTEAQYQSKHPAAIRFGYNKNGLEYHAGIRFKRVYATRTRAEGCCTAWHIEDAYDTLVEVVGSPWVEELQTDTADRQRRLGEKWEMHHYMIYLDSAGCFEVIAASWEALPEEQGSWSKTQAI